MKTISVPNSLEAMMRLDYNCCNEGDLSEYQLSNEYFDLLQEIGFFNSLNKNLNLMISEYEDEIVSVSKIESALKIVEEYKVKFLLYRDLFFEIERLMLLAYEKKTGFLLFF